MKLVRQALGLSVMAAALAALPAMARRPVAADSGLIQRWVYRQPRQLLKAVQGCLGAVGIIVPVAVVHHFEDAFLSAHCHNYTPSSFFQRGRAGSRSR